MVTFSFGNDTKRHVIKKYQLLSIGQGRRTPEVINTPLPITLLSLFHDSRKTFLLKMIYAASLFRAVSFEDTIVASLQLRQDDGVDLMKKV